MTDRSILSLALAGVLAIAGPVAAAAPVPVESLSLEARLSTGAPATLVTVGARTMTLATLRAEHRARVAALRSGASIGASAMRGLKTGVRVIGAAPVAVATTLLGAIHGIGRLGAHRTAASPGPSPSAQATDAADASVQTSAAVDAGDPDFSKWARDYEDFCRQGPVASCTFLPAATTLVRSRLGDGTTIYTTTDPGITDATACAAGNGVLGAQGCTYRYPATSPVRAAATAALTARTDASGIFASQGTGASLTCDVRARNATIVTGSAAAWCFVAAGAAN